MLYYVNNTLTYFTSGVTHLPLTSWQIVMHSNRHKLLIKNVSLVGKDG